jgi:gamma-glutamyltranspeptidase
MPGYGSLSVTVPGAVDGWFTMLGKWGTRSFGEVAARALAYADDGFPLTRRGAWFFARTAQAFEYFDLHDFTNYYGDVRAGTWVRQPEPLAPSARWRPTVPAFTTAAPSAPRSPSGQEAGGV